MFGPVTYSSAMKFIRILILLLAAPLMCAQEQVYPAPKAGPAKVESQLWILAAPVVQEQWRASAEQVNIPTDLTVLEPGQCVRFAIVATGENRDVLLKGAKLKLELDWDGAKQSVSAEQIVVTKQIKPEGSDFVAQVLAAGRVKAPTLTFGSMGASDFQWCAPENLKDGKLKINALAILEDGKTVRLDSRSLELKTIETAQKKKAFDDINSMVPWLQLYHNQPDPAHLMAAMRLVASDSTMRSAFNMKWFLISALKASRPAQEYLAKHLQADSEETRAYAIPLLKLSGYDVEPLLRGMSDDQRAKFENTELPDPHDLKQDSILPQKMDMLWTEFFATGRIEPVRAIASMLAWHKDYDSLMTKKIKGEAPKALNESTMRAVCYAAAGWSMAALSKSDGVVADYIDALKVSADTPEPVKKELMGLYTNPAFQRN